MYLNTADAHSRPFRLCIYVYLTRPGSLIIHYTKTNAEKEKGVKELFDRSSYMCFGHLVNTFLSAEY